MGLETAKRGIMVNQKAMDIVGNNISNLKTKGYTRQRLDTVTVQVHGRGRTLPLAGQGVEAIGVAQVRNSYLDAKFRQEYGDVGYYDQKAAILQELEAAISDPEVENTGIGNALKVLSNALADFSNNADQETHANIVMNAMKGVTPVSYTHLSGTLYPGIPKPGAGIPGYRPGKGLPYDRCARGKAGEGPVPDGCI